MEEPRCSRNYHSFGILKLETFATGVKTGIYSNDPPFTGPPLTEAQMDALIQAYSNKYDEYKSGGPLLKPAFRTAKTNLMGGLDSTADFVDDLAGVDDNMIMLGGFTPVKLTDTDAVKPAQPVIETLKRGESYQIIAECNLVDGAEYYGCIIVQNGPVTNITIDNGKIMIPQNPNAVMAIDVNKGRKKIFNGLDAGATYWVFFYAGNAAGVSNLSLPMSIMAAS